MFNCMCNKIQLEGAINSPNWQNEMHPLATKDSWLSDSLAFVPNWIMHESKIFSMAYKCEQSLLLMTSSWYLHTPYTNSNEFRWLSFYTLRVLLLLAMFVGNTCHKEKPINCQKDKWYHDLVLSCHHPRETHCIVAKTSQLLVYLLNPEVSPRHCNATSNNGHTSLSFTVEEQLWHSIWSLLDPQTFLPLAEWW